MTLSPGTHLGPYQILTSAGAGGMGEVYKARDTRLDRTVAIKVLPSEFAQNVELRHRLEREARAIASLNHPHICILHDVGSQDGIDFLVMEYLEGETLASRLRRGALPLSQALEIAIPIADALDRAHRAGIVHRDLKPGNIILTKSGPKLLDFGLAKSRGPMKGSLLDSAAETEEKTAQGILLGTLAYMAPEQLDGKETDARADVWALGAVLYEMVTGKRAFEGQSSAGLIAAILEHEAPALPHPLLHRVVQKCLAKDPDARFQSAGEVRELLRWVMESKAEATPSVRRWPKERIVWGLLALGLLGLLLFLRRPRTELPEIRVEIVTPETADSTSISLSPDGSRLVFVADFDGKPMLWLRALESTEATPIASTEGAAFPFWSPNGGSLGFFSQGVLKRIDLDGERARVLANAAVGRGGAWNRDGVILFAPTMGPELLQVSDDGGEAAVVLRMTGQPRFPQFLPDQRHFVFFSDRNVYLGSLGSGDTERLFEADTAAVLGPSEFLFLTRDRALLAQRFDFRTLEPVGAPVSVAEPLATDLGKAALATSASALAYRTGTLVPRQLVWFDRSGKRVGALGEPDSAVLKNPEISPDGQRVTVERQVSDRGIWILNARGALSRFTAGDRASSFPVWSPDGTRLLFSTRYGFVNNLFQKHVSGAQEEEVLLESEKISWPLDWSHDGGVVLFAETGPTGRDLMALPLAGDRRPFPVATTRFNETEGQFSPDDRFVAYTSDETGRLEIYVQRFPGPGEKSPVSIRGGAHPRWRPDGLEIFYIAPDASLMAVPVSPTSNGASLEVGSPTKLFSAPIVREATPGINNYRAQYDVSPDGKRFLINVATEDSVTSPITLVLNWKPPEKP